MQIHSVTPNASA